MHVSYQRKSKNKFITLWVAIVSCLMLVSFKVYSQEQDDLDAKSDKKILVVGDSLSAAYKLPTEKGWVYLLGQRLKGEYEVVNASISGATTAAGIPVMQQSLATHQPDIVLLELGANDGLQGKPVKYIRRNLSKLIEMAQAQKAQVVLLGIRLPPNFGKRYTEPFYNQYSSLAEEYGLKIVPFLLDGVAGHPELMMSDGLHPNAKAQKRVLENVWQVLQSITRPMHSAKK